jgi:hypothetical protein
VSGDRSERSIRRSDGVIGGPQARFGMNLDAKDIDGDGRTEP